MARYDPIQGREESTRVIKIVSTEPVENFTVYVIQVCLHCYRWTVRHRYREFSVLHEKLVEEHKIPKPLLPPKKLFGNQTETFIQRRRVELEVYLQTILNQLSHIPPCLAVFLEFHQYEIHGIMQRMAEDLFVNGDAVLQSLCEFRTNPLQLYSLTERLKLPEPTCDTGGNEKDIVNVVDFAFQVKQMQIIGSDTAVGTSNIVPNQVNFSLLQFKSLEKLTIVNCNAACFSEVDNLRKTLQQINAHHSINSLKDILLCDMIHWVEDDSLQSTAAWKTVNDANFSSNKLSAIDGSIKLFPRIEKLDLSHNNISLIENLSSLPALQHLDLSYNRFSILERLHTKLGNLVSLNLSGNQIVTLEGFSKLYSLGTLDVNNNRICEISDVKHVGGLPWLENLNLSGNPVTTVVDYRTSVLVTFGRRFTEICLDNERPSERELDTVAVLQALQKADELSPAKS